MKEERTEDYRWAGPHEWLAEKATSDDPVYVRGLLNSLLRYIDAEDIQEIFQAEMDADGYFDSLGEEELEL